jgi:hypothetical protein
MSQHYFSTTLADRPVTVMLGWNQPPGCVCMVVEHHVTRGADPDEMDESEIYVDFSFPVGREAMSKALTNYRRQLDELELQIPESMWAQLDLDHATDAGTGVLRYAADGTFTYGTPQ